MRKILKKKHSRGSNIKESTMAKQSQLVSIEEYLQHEGHTVGKPNSGGYRLVDDHDSLFVNFKNNAFVWFAQDAKGGLFTLMSKLDDISDRTAQLSKLEQIRNDRDGTFQPTIDDYDLKTVVYDFSKLDTAPLSQRSKDYLTKVRGINPILVNILEEGNFLTDHVKNFVHDGYEKKVHNLMYNWKKADGQIVGSDTQATIPTRKNDEKHQGYWKGIIKGSPAEYNGFNFRVGDRNKARPDRLIVTEAPIDAISYWQMHFKEIHVSGDQVAFLSLSGLKSSVLNRYISDHFLDQDKGKMFLPKSIHFATDNDEKGRAFAKKYAETLRRLNSFDSIDLTFDVPADLTKKDWNDQLCYSATHETKTYDLTTIDQVPFAVPEREASFLQDEQEEVVDEKVEPTLQKENVAIDDENIHDKNIEAYQDISDDIEQSGIGEADITETELKPSISL